MKNELMLLNKSLLSQTQVLANGVYLIGAGPGAHDLITVKGAQILAQADIVFYDALIDENMLSWCPQAKLVPVGKRCGQFSNSQLFINRQLVNAAQKHSIVVRLKGGDPLIFGRASEEIEALRKAGINIEIIPGITTALAASAELQQSPTSRNISRTVTITTLPTKLNYKDRETLIYYMGRGELKTIAQDLLQRGHDKNTPVCIMESVSLKDQRSFGTTLQELAQFDGETLFTDKKPVIALIGEVYRDTLSRIQNLPIHEFDAYNHERIAC
ncbi:uroporphyrin-III C-methyltransferase [Polynucleobacter sp. SHI8]|uniref:uroporphyrinogen-III C-methyltransferase n=1 Tax=unclassified Polynucleobacter TaxID=2640945 RepID=UPI0024923A49|nr:MULTISPECIES: uroporphyrinogen-III C-methyltransferase [unclassified Polynucleobacter]BDW11664.1 uroporphyrin-III C-methyltransferase [Polynucleobacter sp. SHI2]BDW14111.1 uroporphyrin-III C-methyltransferase [Polynucleobacter sp. SHI8]